MEKRRFRFLKKLSEGTFGKVYLAEIITDSKFSKVVAIKLLHAKWAEHDEIIKRSRDEARVLGRLQHRNIIKVEGLVSIGGKCAIIMEYLNGVDLKSLINFCAQQNIAIPKRVIFEIIGSVASALDAAYNKPPLQGGEPLRLIHRDIKPSNIMLTVEGDIKVLDFGTAQAKFEDREAETQALSFGSAAYMSPERFLGDEDRLSGDVYALGVSLYELLCKGRYGKANVRETLFVEEQQRRLEKLDLGAVDSSVEKRIVNLLSGMLHWSEDARPALSVIIRETEDLAQIINDGSLRAFCRDVVEPCKESTTEVSAQPDPLENGILFEDGSETFSDASAEFEGHSSSFPPNQNSSQASSHFPNTGSSPSQSYPKNAETQSAVRNPGPPTPQSVATNQTPEFDPDKTVKASYVHEVDTTQRPIVPNNPPTKQDKPSKSNTMSIAIVVVLLCVVGGVAGWFFTKSSTPKNNPPPVVQVEKNEEVGKPGITDDLGEKNGGEVILRVTHKEPVLVKLRLGKFEYDWDGSGEMHLQHVPTGILKTVIKSGEYSERPIIDVQSEKTCTFEIDVSANESAWKAQEAVCN